MQHTVLLFGPQSKLAGAASVVVETDDGATAAEVLRALSVAAPALADSLRSSRLAVNHEFASPETIVRPDDEVALIGMVSGG